MGLKGNERRDYILTGKLPKDFTGQLLIEANIELATRYALTADGLRGEMIKGDLDAITLKIRYGDMDGQKWVTSCEVVREVWGDGMRVSGVRQERAS